MLHLDILPVCAARGIDRPYAFLARNGFTPHMATSITNGKVRVINLDSLERLCVLLNCTPDDLLRWVPAAGATPNPDHPLAGLNRVWDNGTMMQRLQAMPLEEQQALLRKMNGGEAGE